MRNMLIVLTIALVAIPVFASAGDKIHHGHGMSSSWDSQTGDGPQGSEWVTAPPLPRDFHDGRYYNRNHYGYQQYSPYPVYYAPIYSRNSGLSISYSNGNLSTTFRSSPNYSYSSQQGFYAPGYGYQAYPAYTYPPVQPTYQPTANYQGYQRYPSAPIYSAPANPDLGYYAQPQQPQQQPQVVNIYNYYNDDFAGTEPQRAPLAQPSAPPVTNETVQQQPRAYGTRFFEETALQSDFGLTFFSLDNGRLFVGPENGPPTNVANGVDANLGVLALYQEGLGISLVYKAGGRLLGASEINGHWIEEPCPVAVDFGKEVSLGVLGGAAWVVANSKDGLRYVLSFSGGSWQEVGSGSTPAS